MTALPQSLPMQAPSANVPAPRPLDFSGVDQAFQNAARNLDRVDQARRKADEDVAVREISQYQQQYILSAAERAKLYDGREPGYAEAELAQFDATFKPLLEREDMSDSQRMAITNRVQALRAEYGVRAVTLEGEVRGSRRAADRDAADQASAVRLLMDVTRQFDEKEDDLRKNWDGVSEGYAASVVTAWRELSVETLANAPDAIRERLQPMLLSQEVSLQARVLSAEDDRRDAQTLTTVKEGLTQFVNRASRDPSLIDRIDAELEPILAAAPAYLRQGLRTETLNEARYQGALARISEGKYEDVDTQIKAGAFDDLPAGRLQQLKDNVVSARANGVVVSAQEKADLEAAIQMDLRKILQGEAPDATILERARKAGGEALESEVRINQQAAQNVRPLMARLRTMGTVEAQRELDRLQESAGDAVGLRTLQLAREMIGQDATNRGDPATWAQTPLGPGDRVAENVRAKWQAFQTAPTPENAAAYAAATWIAQQHANIPEPSRRVLDSATAEAWIAELDAEGSGHQQIQQLAAKVGLFGGFRRQVIRELRLAGLGDADLGAMVHYGNSNRSLALYTRDRRTPLNDLVAKREDRDRIDSAVRSQLAPYLQAFATAENRTTSFAAAQRTAYSLVKNGSTVEEAARAATRPMTEEWEFMGTWALPRNRGLSSQRIAEAMLTDVRELVRRNGADGYAPPSDRYTPEQSRRIYADLVEERAYWRNLQDGTGVELVLPGEDGQLRRVKDKAGQDVVRTWDQLSTAASGSGFRLAFPRG